MPKKWPRTEKIPNVIIISCKSATTATIPYFQELMRLEEIFLKAHATYKIIATTTIAIAQIALFFSSAPIIGPIDSKRFSSISWSCSLAKFSLKIFKIFWCDSSPICLKRKTKPFSPLG